MSIGALNHSDVAAHLPPVSQGVQTVGFEPFNVDVETFAHGHDIVSRTFIVREGNEVLLSGVQGRSDCEWAGIQWTQGNVEVIEGSVFRKKGRLDVLVNAVLQTLAINDQVKQTCGTLSEDLREAMEYTFVRTFDGKQVADLNPKTRPQKRGGGR